jgi:hypothetical protein
VQPVLFDFESSSAADLPRVGGRRYAAHESTRIVCLCCLIDGHFHLWLPGQEITLPAFADLWPGEHGPPRPLHLWGGENLPSPIADAVAEGREFIAHNCHQFDEHVWRAKLSPVPVKFGDSIHGCRAAGLPARLEALGMKFFGFGKNAGGLIMRKLMTLESVDGRYVNKNLNDPGMIAAAGRYCVADVCILERVMRELRPSVEPDVIDAHVEINNRGVALDQPLAREITALSVRAAAEAGAEVERITGGELTAADLKSVTKVKKWVEGRGLKLKSLRKQDVQRLLDDPDAFVRDMLEEAEEA